MANEKLIDAEKLKLAIRDDAEIDGKNYARMKKHINEAPRVDAVEVVHGHWIECEGTVCSVCNTHFFVDGPWAVANYRANYCPNCGAKMDGGYRKCVDIAQQPLWD